MQNSIRVTKRIFSFRFSVLSFSQTVDRIIQLAIKKQSVYICVANVHMTVEAKRDKAFAQVLKGAHIALLDGMPLCWAMRIIHNIKPERIAGRHLMHALLEAAVIYHQPVFFYGSTPETLQKANHFLLVNYPGIQIAGIYSPPFRKLSEEEDAAAIALIKLSGASIVFVALGCPKQENWMAAMKGKIPAVMLGIGVALEILTAQQRSSPKWMERVGLEWLFRLMKEPRRLFGRYFVTNSIFIGMLGTVLYKKYLVKNIVSK